MVKVKFYKSFFALLILAIITATFHNHSDLKDHSDCEICIIQSNVLDGDTPIDVVYVENLSIKNEDIVLYIKEYYDKKPQTFTHQRAPPIIT